MIRNLGHRAKKQKVQLPVSGANSDDDRAHPKSLPSHGNTISAGSDPCHRDLQFDHDELEAAAHFPSQSGTVEAGRGGAAGAIESTVAGASGSDDECSSHGSDVDDVTDGPFCGSLSPSPAISLQAPTLEQASSAVTALLGVIRTRRGSGAGWVYTSIDSITLTRLKEMLRLFRMYTLDSEYKGKWIGASQSVAVSEGRSMGYGRTLRKWCQDFSGDHKTLPENRYGSSSTSALHSDEDLVMDIVVHLQSIGSYFSAGDLLQFINRPEILEKIGRHEPLSIRTSQRWLKLLGFRWKLEAKGMYTDGHEREDVVKYRQEVFLPTYQGLHRRSAKFDDNGGHVPQGEILSNGELEVVFHHHDESTFYGNDRRKLRWVHSSESPKPYAKGEGLSLMVADFVSSKFGWLTSPDRSQSARVTLRPGKARDGYFSNEEVLGQLSDAMDTLETHYGSYQHVFVLDNARTHTKRAESSLSARRMTKNPKASFVFSEIVRDSAGRAVQGENGQPKMEDRKMDGAKFADGTPQDLYFAADHPQFPGWFKGMTEILRERGYAGPEKIKAECPGFKCDPSNSRCCQRRILFQQPDFVSVPSLAERHCQARGFQVLFLPKFHPELNFIEMCWGYAKRLYRELPSAPRIEQIEANALQCLDGIPLASMRR
jgi:hypothetical protein